MIGETLQHLRWLRSRWLLSSAGGSEPGALLIVLFHGLFHSKREAYSGVCDPQQGITVQFFREFVETLLSHGIAIRTLEEGLSRPPSGLEVCLTFDDGYFSNFHALGVLEQFRVPATFFISTRHVQQQKSFWWDTLYREAVRRGVAPREIQRRRRQLKQLQAEVIDAELIEAYGRGALVPVSDCDRPFSPEELAQFAQSKFVQLGNHTGDHAILVNYDQPGIRAQIDEAQRFLAQITGATPKGIAYPNGDYDSRVLDVARTAGLEFGVTTRPGLNRFAAHLPMELRRVTIWGAPTAARQGRAFGALASRHRPT